MLYKPSSGSPKAKGWLPEEDVLCTRTQVHVILSSIQHPGTPIPTWEGDDCGYYGNYSCILHVINGDKQLVC